MDNLRVNRYWPLELRVQAEGASGRQEFGEHEAQIGEPPGSSQGMQLDG